MVLACSSGSVATLQRRPSSLAVRLRKWSPTRTQQPCLEGCDDESHGAAPPALPQQVWRASEELLTGSQMTLVMCRPHCEEQGAQASPLNPP